MNNPVPTAEELQDRPSLLSELASLLNASSTSIEGALRLLLDGNTIPFIARYRKEQISGLDERQLRKIEDAWQAETELASRKQTILKTLTERTDVPGGLLQAVRKCRDKARLEDLYLPYRPSRKTRAAKARQAGLGPLAEILLRQQATGVPINKTLNAYLNPAENITTPDEALAGACDIVAEVWAEDAEVREWLTENARRHGRLQSSVKRGKQGDGEKFQDYFDYSERVQRMASHRFLALQRGVAEGILRVRLVLDQEIVLEKLSRRWLRNPRFEFVEALQKTADDCLRRLLQPAVESRILSELKQKADADSTAVFAENLHNLLMAPPAGRVATLGMDPGFRTGCKLAVVDENGRYLEDAVIYPVPPRNDEAGAATVLARLIEKHNVQLIALGNGTASRETARFVRDFLKGRSDNVQLVVVNEAGASVYSAGEVALQEYPDLDVTVRGAISIAHRLQDPLAELVKIDPRSIGVGQYQHDVDQKELQRALDREVTSCVNQVGVDLNSASASLLAHVSGLGPTLAGQVVRYREEHDGFRSRSELKKVPRLGPKAFEQCAGFLRISGGREVLDASGVHPESYPVVRRMAAAQGCHVSDLVGNQQRLEQLRADDFVGDGAGKQTVEDILSELAKPGRDPRAEFDVVEFDEAVNEIGDLRVGMKLNGIVTNVTRFGAFVDIGVHQDGLIHISHLANHFVSDPAEIVGAGDRVEVEVLEVDESRKRISLSRKNVLAGA